MGLIFWVVVSVLLQVNFGLLPGIFLTLVLLIAEWYILERGNIKTERDIQLLTENLVISVEVVNHNGSDVILVTEALTKKFLAQGNDIKEIVVRLQERFTNRNIFLIKEDMTLVPLYTAPAAGKV